MSRNISHPDPQKRIQQNTTRIKQTRQKPEAFDWWTPNCDETVSTQAELGCSGLEPSLQNSFAQPAAPLELWAFRLKIDGDLQFKGVLDASAASSGTIAVTLPGINAGEVDFVPEKDTSYPTWVTLDGSEIIAASARVDSTTGDLTITWATGTAQPWIALSGGAATAPSGTVWPIPFADLTYDPALVTQGVIFDWAITDTGDTGNDRFELETLLEGWYEWELVTQWDQVTTGGTVEFGYAMQRISFTPGLNSPFGDNDLRNSADWFDFDLHPEFEMVDNPWLRGGGVLFADGAKTWLPTATQVTGVDRGLSGILLRVVYRGADDSAGWTFATV